MYFCHQPLATPTEKQKPNENFSQQLQTSGQNKISLRGPLCHLSVLVSPSCSLHLSAALVSLKVKEMGEGDEVMTGYRDESQWGQLCQRGTAQSTSFSSAVPRAESKYMSFLNSGLGCAFCVTSFYHLLQEHDPDVHALMCVHSFECENVCVCV